MTLTVLPSTTNPYLSMLKYGQKYGTLCGTLAIRSNDIGYGARSLASGRQVALRYDMVDFWYSQERMYVLV